VRIAAVTTCALLLAATHPARAGGDDAAALYQRLGCPVCHGPEGRHPAQDAYPGLAGQRRAYLVQQLRDLRSGVRSNGQSRLMWEFSQRLSDEAIATLAQWLSGLAPCASDRC
jgi:cytochrome c553